MNKELADYLKSKPGLNRLFIELKQKYISLGRYRGSVKLENITQQESIDISNLLGRKIGLGESVKTSFTEITKKIEQGKYHGFDWQQLFHSYFKYEVVSKQEQKNLDNQKEESFFQKLLLDYRDHPHIKEISEIVENENEIYKVMKQKYRKDAQNFRQEFHNILLLLSNIPTTPTSLPMFSSITGNPHYLDFNRSESNLFLRILSYLKRVENPISVQEKVDLLSEINIYTDPISNFVITYRLLGNLVLNELAFQKQVINLNLLNLNYIEILSTNEGQVFIFENPSILNALIGKEIAVIITSGMPNLSCYRVLDKLKDNGVEMYYNGDFDAEGLLIAEKLKDRYPNLKLFNYHEVDYEQSKSKEIISDSRLKKLNHVVTPELQEIKQILLKRKLAAYQERNIPRIIEYIQNLR